MLKRLKNIIFIELVIFFLLSPVICIARTNYFEAIKSHLKHGAVYVTGKDGAPVMKINESEKLVPASILKIVTASAAYHYLKGDYRFTTEFYTDSENNLYVKGYGDPLLISEELSAISGILKAKGLKEAGAIFLDNSYFDEGIMIDGVENSLNPYDATNGALCVNFNTINVRVKATGEIVSRESQTPITEFAKKLVRAGSAKRGKGKDIDERIILSHKKDETLLYTGHLLREFLLMAGVKASGGILKKKVPVGAKLFYAHSSSKSLDEVISSMMKYSNNFIANQIFLTIGAKVYGEPATVKKGVDAVKAFLKKRYGVTDIDIVEGSGISRKNAVRAADFIKVLDDYKKEHMDTLSGEDGLVYKTGTLSDVKSAAGYIERKKSGVYSFVVILNDERDAGERDRVLKVILRLVHGDD